MSTALRTSLVAAYLTEHPWMIRRAMLESICAVVARHERGDKLAAHAVGQIVAERDERQSRKRMCYEGLGCVEPMAEGPVPYVNAEGVAVIPVHGMITKYASMINGMSQPTGMSSDRIVHAVEMAQNDPRVRSLVLDIDSPGGTVAGGEDLVVGMRAARKVGGKPMVALAHDQCCSGGYLVAALCDAVYCTENSMVGSCGVYCVIEDSSKMLESEGVQRRVVSSGEFKGAFEMGTPITEGQITELQRNITSMAKWYVTRTLVEGRGMSQADADAIADGRVWVGSETIAVGLCDGVTTLAELVKSMRANGSKLN